MKTTHKFNGRKGVKDEVLELPIRIMQSNIGWLATRGFLTRVLTQQGWIKLLECLNKQTLSPTALRWATICTTVGTKKNFST